jgi:hypothetical protein
VSKFFKRGGFTFCFIFLVSVLAACGEPTPAPQASPSAAAPPVNPTTQTALLPATTAPATVTPAPATTSPTATLVATPTVMATPTVAAVPTTGDADLQKAVPVVGDLPAPPDARKLNFTIDMLKSLQKRLGGKPGALDLTGLTIGAYAAIGQPVDTFDYYRAVLRAKGWTETHAYNNLYGIYFEKGGQVAIVTAVGVPDDTTVTFLAGFIPEVKGQIQGGEVLVLLGQGPPAVFQILRK